MGQRPVQQASNSKIRLVGQRQRGLNTAEVFRQQRLRLFQRERLRLVDMDETNDDGGAQVVVQLCQNPAGFSLSQQLLQWMQIYLRI